MELKEATDKIRELSAENEALRKQVVTLKRSRDKSLAASAKAVAAAHQAREEAERIGRKFSGQEQVIAELQTALAKERQARATDREQFTATIDRLGRQKAVEQA
mgnify:CR=1 FL=1